MNLSDPIKLKTYSILINTLKFSVKAFSLGEALRKAGDLLLEDTDVVMVKLEKE